MHSNITKVRRPRTRTTQDGCTTRIAQPSRQNQNRAAFAEWGIR